MSEMERIRELIEAGDEILIVGHKDADGDTLGCSLAFAEALRARGKQVWVAIPPPVPSMYDWLPGFHDIVERPPRGADPRLVLFFDSGSMERSGQLVDHISSEATIVNVDHHMSNTRFGQVNLIDPGAAAVGEMVLRMLEEFGWPITPGIATNLYTALMTDTGGFRHENTTAACLEAAARLARLGANPSRIASMVYKSRPMTTLRLSALSMATLRTEAEGRLISARVTRRMLRESGAVMSESEGIIDTLNSIGGIEIAILLKEVTAALTKISVRTRGEIDASELTAHFGGGGHYRAAGAEIQLPIDEAEAQVLGEALVALGVEASAGRRSQRR